VGPIASCELDQPALQQLLYDLEAGMPLFVDRLVAQAPEASTAGGGKGGRMRVFAAGVGPVAGSQMTRRVGRLGKPHGRPWEGHGRLKGWLETG
jgi:Type II secretion system (T2SS), protein M subtype b